MLKTLINPENLPRPKGYSHALRMWPCGRMLFLSGQVGWTGEGRFVSSDVLGQFSQCLANLKTAAEAGGGRMDDIVQMRIYVTDVPEYKRQAKQLGAVWREFFGGYYPAMTLVGVDRLWEDEAKIEIEAVAVLPPPPSAPVKRAAAAAKTAASPAAKPAAKHPRR
jgi:enamine deaminase RidA (YjgF/YER057c/UK114 family)